MMILSINIYKTAIYIRFIYNNGDADYQVNLPDGLIKEAENFVHKWATANNKEFINRNIEVYVKDAACGEPKRYGA